MPGQRPPAALGCREREGQEEREGRGHRSGVWPASYVPRSLWGLTVGAERRGRPGVMVKPSGQKQSGAGAALPTMLGVKCTMCSSSDVAVSAPKAHQPTPNDYGRN